MTTNLENAHILVTGEADSLTAALASGLASRGATLSAIRIDADERVRSTSTFALRKAIDGVESATGPIDVLVHVLGHVTPGALRLSDDAHKDSSLHVLRELYDVVQEVGRRMLERGTGRIIVVTSVLGVRGVTNTSLESATSAAAQGFVRSLALEWVRGGVAVNAIAVGVMHGTSEAADELEAGALRYSPVRRLTQPDDVSGTVAYLASPLAGFIVGETIIVDGGLSAHA